VGGFDPAAVVDAGADLAADVAVGWMPLIRPGYFCTQLSVAVAATSSPTDAVALKMA